MTTLTTKPIEQRNAEFQALTPEQKRVKIAEDALALMDAERIHSAPLSGYLSLHVSEHADNRRTLDERLTVDASPPCEVCAMGALFAGHVLNTNRVRLKDCYIGEFIVRNLRGIYSADQLRLIEAAYEGRTELTRKIDGMDDALFFGQRHGTPYRNDIRLRAILQNIITNQGEFRP